MIETECQKSMDLHHNTRLILLHVEFETYFFDREETLEQCDCYAFDDLQK